MSRRLRDYRLALLMVLAMLSTACAGPASRPVAPIENRGAEQAEAPPPSAQLIPAPRSPADTAALPDTTPLPAPAPEQQLALVEPALSVPGGRSTAASALLTAALKAVSEGEWERAQSALERAIRLAPDDHDLWRQLAYTHLRQGQFAQARELANRSLQLAGGDSAARARSQRLLDDIAAAAP